jgi:hypothetical protein
MHAPTKAYTHADTAHSDADTAYTGARTLASAHAGAHPGAGLAR